MKSKQKESSNGKIKSRQKRNSEKQTETKGGKATRIKKTKLHLPLILAGIPDSW
jgi:hypothetical protein